MIPQFPEFKKIELSDKDEVTEITSKYDLYSDFEFGSLWSWDVKEEIELSILNQNLVVRFTDYLSGDTFLGFIGNTEITDTVTKLLAYSHEKNYQPVLSLIPECSVHGLDLNTFEIEESRDHFDYVLDVSRYIDYSGGKLKSRRNFLNGFLKMHPDYVSTTLDLADEKTKEEVSELYRKWQEAKGFLTLSEAFAYERFLEHSEHFNYLGVGIRVHGKLVAFHISMLPTGKVANGLFEKADTAYHGIHAILMHEVAKKLLERGYTHLNYEQDLGIENLRKSKLAYDPAYFMKKYNIKQLNKSSANMEFNSEINVRLRKPIDSDLLMIKNIYSRWWIDKNNNQETENINFFTSLVSKSIHSSDTQEKFFVASTEDNTILGIVGYAETPFNIFEKYISTTKPIQLSVVMVDKEATGKGIGTTMLREFEEWAKSKEYTEIILSSADRWKESWSFYSKQGYTDLGELENDKGWHTRIFTKKIS